MSIAAVWPRLSIDFGAGGWADAAAPTVIRGLLGGVAQPGRGSKALVLGVAAGEFSTELHMGSVAQVLDRSRDFAGEVVMDIL